MGKHIIIFREVNDESYDDFHSRIRGLVDQVKSTIPGLYYLHYTITLEDPPKRSVIPFRKDKIALVSVKAEKGNYMDPMKSAGGYAGTFAVTEALPIAYNRDWPEGKATPGVCLLTLFRQKRGIGRETFIDRWHNGHTPLTLKIHPIYHYNRNEVTVTTGNPPVHFDGIVEEHCRTRNELLNPFKFFAKSGFAPVNMIKTYFDVNSFIDYKSIETYLVREFVVMD
ncbi:MAG: EthD domain-containing protein [Bacteroidales bacterium]|nr:EthD domain-containing protein [Bacteroidales bacterium]